MMSGINRKKVLSIKKAAMETVRKFDAKHDPEDDTPVALWALAEALGIHIAMTSCLEHQGQALTTTLNSFLSGADRGMEFKRELNASDEELGVTVQ